MNRPLGRVLPVLLLIYLLLAGCTEATPPSSPATQAPTPSPSPPPEGTVPARILGRGYLLVGVRFDLPPFCSVTEEGTLEGFEVDLARQLAHRWLGDPAAVRFRQVRSDTAVRHILMGDVDLVLALLPHTQENEEEVDFGPTYFLDGPALLVRASDAPSLTVPSDLESRVVGFAEGAQAADALEATVEFTPTVRAYPDLEAAAAALRAGEVDAVTDLRRRLVRVSAEDGGLTVLPPFTTWPAAPAFAPNEPGLADLVAITLQQIWSDGTLDELYNRWLPGISPPRLETWPGFATLSLQEAAQAPRVTDTIGRILARGRLRVAMVSDRPPFAYLDASGEPVGYEVGLVRALAQRWLGDSGAVDFLPATEEEGMRLLSRGEADLLIGAVAHTQEAETRIDFSLLTYLGGEGVLVRAGTVVEGLTDLDGQTIAVVQGSASPEVIQRAVRSAGISPVIVLKPTLEEATAALQAGEVAAVIAERTRLLVPAYTTPGLVVTALRLTEVPLAIGLPPGDSALRDLVNLTLQAMWEDGTFVALYGEWFEDSPPRVERWPGQPQAALRLTPGAP